MIFSQRPPSLDLTDSILAVESDIFAELKSETKDFYFFDISFKILFNTLGKDPRSYDKVVITVKEKETAKKANSSIKRNLASTATGLVSNGSPNRQPTLSMRLKPRNGLPAPKLPPAVSAKAFSGLQLVQDSAVKETFIDQVTVSIASLSDDIGDTHAVTELILPTYKPQRGVVRSRSKDVSSPGSKVVTDPGFIDPTDTLTRINAERVDITSPTTHPFLRSLTSESQLDDPRLRDTGLGFDMTKYYLDVVRGSPKEDTHQWYEKLSLIHI